MHANFFQFEEQYRLCFWSLTKQELESRILKEPAQCHGTEARSNPGPISLSNYQFQCPALLLVDFNFHCLGFGLLLFRRTIFRLRCSSLSTIPPIFAKLPLR